MLVIVRSAFFLLLQVVLTPLFAFVMTLAIPLGHRVEYRLARAWCVIMVHAVRLICGIRYRVLGTQNLPSTPAVVLSKHQSAWETMFFLLLLPPQVWVVKRELLRVPFFGWGLALLKPIAIDRGAARGALTQVGEQGAARLREGLWIVAFPEGTRVAPGERRRYAVSGAWLAARAGAPIVPVALNSGSYWRRNAFLKYPGTITVSIGPSIDPGTEKPEVLMRQAEAWIESEVARISAPPQAAAAACANSA